MDRHPNSTQLGTRSAAQCLRVGRPACSNPLVRTNWVQRKPQPRRCSDTVTLTRQCGGKTTRCHSSKLWILLAVVLVDVECEHLGVAGSLISRLLSSLLGEPQCGELADGLLFPAQAVLTPLDDEDRPLAVFAEVGRPRGSLSTSRCHPLACSPSLAMRLAPLSGERDGGANHNDARGVGSRFTPN